MHRLNPRTFFLLRFLSFKVSFTLRLYPAMPVSAVEDHTHPYESVSKRHHRRRPQAFSYMRCQLRAQRLQIHFGCYSYAGWRDNGNLLISADPLPLPACALSDIADANAQGCARATHVAAPMFAEARRLSPSLPVLILNSTRRHSPSRPDPWIAVPTASPAAATLRQDTRSSTCAATPGDGDTGISDFSTRA
ncbi:hypothetical protein C8J57DRAFT_1730936 [Mycena rebaudengoi]|nr:hypothetical protein C8J57DRAFT_1730936 [Mycena rebaudengoi]